jgi:hypothetical protein
VDTPFSTTTNTQTREIEVTVRTSDGQTVEIEAHVSTTLRAVLDEVTAKLHFHLAGNQVAYFSFNGVRYDIEGRHLGDIVGLKDDDQIALLVETRSG